MIHEVQQVRIIYLNNHYTGKLTPFTADKNDDTPKRGKEYVGTNKGMKRNENPALPTHENDPNSEKVKSVYLLPEKCTSLAKTPSPLHHDE